MLSTRLTVAIPNDEVNPDLPFKLQAEWPGILAWGGSWLPKVATCIGNYVAKTSNRQNLDANKITTAVVAAGLPLNLRWECLVPSFYFEYLIAESIESLRQKIASERCPCWIHESAIL
jgi:hypothetical protein